MQIPREHLDIDTRTPPAGAFGGTTVHGMFIEQPNTFADSVTSSSTGAQPSTIATGVPDLSSSIGINEPISTQTLSPSTLYINSNSSTSNTRSTYDDKLSGGAIFAIIVGIIVGIFLPVILLTQNIKRGKRIREENVVLDQVLVTGIADEKAQGIGLKRLQEASARKWAGDDLVPIFEQGDPEARRAREKAKEERLLLHSLFEPRHESSGA